MRGLFLCNFPTCTSILAFRLYVECLESNRVFSLVLCSLWVPSESVSWNKTEKLHFEEVILPERGNPKVYVPAKLRNSGQIHGTTSAKQKTINSPAKNLKITTWLLEHFGICLSSQPGYLCCSSLLFAQEWHNQVRHPHCTFTDTGPEYCDILWLNIVILRLFWAKDLDSKCRYVFL